MVYLFVSICISLIIKRFCTFSCIFLLFRFLFELIAHSDPLAIFLLGYILCVCVCVCVCVCFNIFIGVQLLYTAVLVSAV